MAKDKNEISISKMSRADAFRKARDLLHQENVPHENQKHFDMCLSLVMLGWTHLGIIED